MFAAIVGFYALRAVIKRTNRQSIVLFVLSGIILAMGIAYGIKAAMVLTEDLKDDNALSGFNDFCPNQ